jgi:phage terminase large subunit-like protein
MTWPNGSWATIYSNEEPDQTRGSRVIQRGRMSSLSSKTPSRFGTTSSLACRSARQISPDSLITTTPRPLKILKDISALPTTSPGRWIALIAGAAAYSLWRKLAAATRSRSMNSSPGNTRSTSTASLAYAPHAPSNIGPRLRYARSEAGQGHARRVVRLTTNFEAASLVCSRYRPTVGDRICALLGRTPSRAARSNRK